MPGPKKNRRRGREIPGNIIVSIGTGKQRRVISDTPIFTLKGPKVKGPTFLHKGILPSGNVYVDRRKRPAKKEEAKEK